MDFITFIMAIVAILAVGAVGTFLFVKYEKSRQDIADLQSIDTSLTTKNKQQDVQMEDLSAYAKRLEGRTSSNLTTMSESDNRILQEIATVRTNMTGAVTRLDQYDTSNTAKMTSVQDELKSVRTATIPSLYSDISGIKLVNDDQTRYISWAREEIPIVKSTITATDVYARKDLPKSIYDTIANRVQTGSVTTPLYNITDESTQIQRDGTGNVQFKVNNQTALTIGPASITARKVEATESGIFNAASSAFLTNDASQKTTFPAADFKNYIRGNTDITGETNVMGSFKVQDSVVGTDLSTSGLLMAKRASFNSGTDQYATKFNDSITGKNFISGDTDIMGTTRVKKGLVIDGRADFRIDQYAQVPQLNSGLAVSGNTTMNGNATINGQLCMGTKCVTQEQFATKMGI